MRNKGLGDTKAKKGFRANLPEGIRIGERFLLRFDDPRVEAGAYQGRLQDLSKTGLLCFDAPTDPCPPRGTPVTVLSLQQTAGRACSFSSEIRGRGRLHGRVPVLLVEPPEQVGAPSRHRGAYRVTVCLRGELTWREGPREDPRRECAVITNLSGGGAQVFLRHRPQAAQADLLLDPPPAFVEECARRLLPRTGLTAQQVSLAANPFTDACAKVRSRFCGIRARVAGCHLHTRDSRGPVYAVSLAFSEAREICFQLVHYLERQSLRKGLRHEGPARAGHVRAAGRPGTLATAA